MDGPILRSDTKVAWASRTDSPMFARVERTSSMPSTSPDSRSPRIILPPAEHRFADSSPSPYPTLSPVGGNPHDQSPSAISEGATPLSLGHHNSPFDIYGMHLPGVSNNADGFYPPNQKIVSAPAELHQLHRKITMDSPETRLNTDVPREYQNQQSSKMRIHSTPIRKHAPPSQSTSSLQQAIMEQSQQDLHEFRLDRTAPTRALRHPPASSSTGTGGQFGNLLTGIVEEQRGQSGTPESLPEAGERGERPEIDGEGGLECVPSPGQVEGAIDKRAEVPPTWGEPFKLQWIRTERLPFYRTKHLRNPWNHDREIKVSRDGTELEPSVGQALLEEWDRVIEESSKEHASQQTGQGGMGGGKQQGKGKGGGVGGGGQRGKRKEEAGR